MAVLFTMISCGPGDRTEVHHEKRNKEIFVGDGIVNIDFNSDYLIGRSRVYIMQDYLLVMDLQPFEKSVHIFDKNDFGYISSVGTVGKGPFEVIRPGGIGINRENGFFYLTDLGNMVAYRFSLDSAINQKDYQPASYFKLQGDLFPTTYSFVNDSIIIGTAIQKLEGNSWRSAIYRHNIKSGTGARLGSHHPDADIDRKSIYFDLSNGHELFVLGYPNNDLMRILDLEGKIVKEIYGPDWSKGSKPGIGYYNVTRIMGDKIISTFRGGPKARVDNNGNLVSIMADKLHVYDLQGHYLKTLLLNGNGILDFCVDEGNNRIIGYFDGREEPFGYIDLEGLF